MGLFGFASHGGIGKERAAHKLHALIICATGYGSAQLLKNRVVSEFGKILQW